MLEDCVPPPIEFPNTGYIQPVRCTHFDGVSERLLDFRIVVRIRRVNNFAAGIVQCDDELRDTRFTDFSWRSVDITILIAHDVRQRNPAFGP